VKESSDISASKQNVNDLGAITKQISNSMTRLLEATRDAAGTSSESSSKSEFTERRKNVVGGMTLVVEAAKKVANNPKNKTSQNDLGDSFTRATTQGYLMLQHL